MMNQKAQQQHHNTSHIPFQILLLQAHHLVPLLNSECPAARCHDSVVVTRRVAHVCPIARDRPAAVRHTPLPQLVHSSPHRGVVLLTFTTERRWAHHSTHFLFCYMDHRCHHRLVTSTGKRVTTARCQCIPRQSQATRTCKKYPSHSSQVSSYHTTQCCPINIFLFSFLVRV